MSTFFFSPTYLLENTFTMIETVIIPILFVALAINVPIMIAYLMGLQFQIKNPDCSQDVKDVKNNILLTKVVQVLNVTLFAVLMILCACI